MKKLNLLVCMATFLLTGTVANAQVGIGTVTPDPSSVLDVASTDRGMLLPRMTTIQRDAIETPSEGLMIFNIDSQCLEIYNASEAVWKANCGADGETTAVYSPDCSSVSVQGNYYTGHSLDADINTLTIKVDVSEIGTYAIVTSANGMVFTASGTFTELGTQTIVLNGQGYPTQVGTNFVSFVIGSEVCSTIIYVEDGVANVTACGTKGAQVGEFIAGQAINVEDVQVALTGVTYTGGEVFGFNTNTVNGISISAPLSGSFMSASPASLDLVFQGTPIAAGNTIINYSINNKTGCSVTVPVLSGTGRASAMTCTGALSGTYTSTVAMTASNTKVVNLTVSTPGTFSLRTDTVNGIYFAGTATASANGALAVTLTAVGTPAISGTFPYVVTVSSSATAFVTCTFNVIVVLPPSVPNMTNIGCTPATAGTRYAYIKANNTNANDGFSGGTDSVKLSADGLTMAVGAHLEDGSGLGVNSANNNSAADGGAAYVYTRASLTSVWAFQSYIKANNTNANDRFGFAVDLSADGNTLAVGAYLEDGSGTGVNPSNDNASADSGAVYIYQRTGTTWAFQAYIKASNTGNTDGFGVSAKLSGDGNTLVVGAFNESSSGAGVNGPNNNAATYAGAAYVYTRSGSTWTFSTYLKPLNPDAQDRFGRWVAINNDGATIAVSSYGEDGNGYGVNPLINNNLKDSGAVYIFVKSGATYTQQAYIKAGNRGAADYFGYDVDLSDDGNTMAVGGRNEDSNSLGVNGSDNQSAVDSGAAYVFSRTGTTWTQEAFMKASNTGAGDLFGHTVAISRDGNSVLVGAFREDSSTSCVNPVQNNTGENNGAAYHFFKISGKWSQGFMYKSQASTKSDQFGQVVALSGIGNVVAIGANAEDGAGVGINPTVNETAASAGAVYVYTAQ